jgi:hypothetical protein
MNLISIIINIQLTSMKALRFSAAITAVLGFFSVLAIIFLYLALSDIAHNEPDQKLEWYVAGICMMILGAFIVSSFVTLGYLFSKVNLKDIPAS